MVHEMSVNKKKSRKWIWTGVSLIAIVVVAVVGAPRLREQLAERQSSQVETGEIVTAFIGDLSAQATASGQVQAQREAQLALASSGQVAQIFVQVGESVQVDDALLKLDSSTLERAVASAQQGLVIQEANLAMLLAPPDEADLMAAEAAVISAQAQLDELLAGPSEEDITAADANVRAAQANVWAASEQLQLANSGAGEAEIAAAQAELIAALGEQEATQDLYDRLLECFSFPLPTGENLDFCPGLGNPEETTRYNLAVANANAATARARLDALLAGPDPDAVAIAQASLAAANARLEAAEANQRLLLSGASQAQLAAAEANLAQAQANLQALRDGPSASQITTAEIAVEQARINVEKAQMDLDRATLYAPFTGVVTAIHVNEGEIANGILIEMVDDTSLEVVLDVDEVDIGSLAAGQPAVVTLETWPDIQIESQVASISPLAKNDLSALVVYEVFLSLQNTTLPVRVGMTADADLLTANYEDVLLVPTAAIRADRSSGTFSVNKVTEVDGNQTVEEVDVTIGLRDNTFTQITSGLNEGDQLLVGDTLPVLRFEPGEGPPPGRGPNNGGGFGE
jgi:HlyD family secretion protein